MMNKTRSRKSYDYRLSIYYRYLDYFLSFFSLHKIIKNIKNICVISNKNKIKFTEKLVINFYSFEN